VLKFEKDILESNSSESPTKNTIPENL
jgi:hypothetical protein